jgi:hypothetical protein
MRFAWALLVGAALAGTSGRAPSRQVIEVSTASQLTDALAEPAHDVTINVAPGRYMLSAASNHSVEGEPLTVSGRNIRIVGSSNRDVVITATSHTAVFFNDCSDCELDGVEVVGGVRTKSSSVSISNCGIEKGLRTGNSSISVSNCRIQVIGTYSANVLAEFNEITRGVFLNGGQRVILRHNLIEAGNFEEPGILVGGTTSVVAERNIIRGFTTGIQLVENASLEGSANIIEQIQGVGILGTENGLGRVALRENVIYHCGGSGIELRADGDQNATHNLVVETGLTEPKESAVLAVGARADAAVRKNTLFDNTVLNQEFDRDVSREAFWRARRPWTRTYRNTPVGVDGRHRFYESAFLTRYGRWAD